jgi:cell division protein FtsZ
VAEAAHPDANIIFGAMLDEKLEDQVWVTVVATGYGDERPRRFVADRPGSELIGERPLLREPQGEPRVSRVRERAPAIELEVPEFIPRR